MKFAPGTATVRTVAVGPAGDREQSRLEGPAVLVVDERVEDADRAEDRVAKGDEQQWSVSFRYVARVPRRGPAPLGQYRTKQLESQQGSAGDNERPEREM
jgi:hypothetical protein